MKYMEVNNLDWDSVFFNINVGEIINPDTNYIVLKEKFDLIYLKSERNCEAKIEGYVNSFTETKVLFSKLIDQKREINQNDFSISETNEDRAEHPLISRQVLPRCTRKPA